MMFAKHLCAICGWLLVLGWFATCVSAKDAPATLNGALHVEDRTKLWKLIHDGCVPAAARNTYPPAPCIEVNAANGITGGYAVFKDRAGQFQYLVLPLARITGIESPALLTPDAPNYFADAWAARLYVEAALHTSQPRDVLSMVVNSVAGRSQDQLHIHIDCIRPDVHNALTHLQSAMTGQWQTLSEPLPPHQHMYRAMWIDGDALSANPFQSLARSLPAGDSMASHSLIVVGARSLTGQPGFILLSGHVAPSRGDRGSGDELQDPTCAMATRPAL